MMMFSSGTKVEPRRRINDDASARQALADVVVGVAFEDEGHARRDETRRSSGRRSRVKCRRIGVVGQSLRAVPAGDLAAGEGADDAVDVADGEFGADGLPPFDGRGAQGQQYGLVERLFEAVVLGDLAVTAHVGVDLGLVEEVREVEPPGLPVVDGPFRVEEVGAADHLVDRAEAESGHPLPDFLGDEAHEVDHVLGLAGEVAAQARVLGGHADRAGVEVADAHHDAARG